VTITTDRYRGPRAFNGDIEQVKRDLQQMPREMDRALEKLSRGVARRWLVSAILVSVTGVTNKPVAFDTLTRVNSAPGGTVNLNLPAPDPDNIGRELGVIRMSTVGTLVWLPPTGTFVNGAASVTLAATVGYYTVTFDGAGYYTLG
jgi:hypothetical protein